jgi:hypothetical protein
VDIVQSTLRSRSNAGHPRAHRRSDGGQEHGGRCREGQLRAGRDVRPELADDDEPGDDRQCTTEIAERLDHQRRAVAQQVTPGGWAGGPAANGEGSGRDRAVQTRHDSLFPWAPSPSTWSGR